MNREIKFRAWDGKKMLFSENSGFYIMPNGIQVPSSTGHEFYDKDYPLMQYTGLKDKYGKEIYEGDILGWESHEGKKHQTRWVVDFNPITGYKSWSSSLNDEIIIGNIYENPELSNL